MTSIYESSTKVVVWLGSEADESGLAIDRLNYLAGKALAELRPGETIDGLLDRLRQDESWVPWSPDEVPDLSSWNSITLLLQRPWWTRVWILQEATVPGGSHVVMCGELDLFGLGLG